MRRRDIAIAIGAVLLALILGGSVLRNAVIETGSWGLSYQTEGAPPQGPLDAKSLVLYVMMAVDLCLCMILIENQRIMLSVMI